LKYRKATTARIVSGTIEPTTPPTMAGTFVPPFGLVVPVGPGRPVEVLVIVLFGPERLLVAIVTAGGVASGSRPMLIATVSLYISVGNEVQL
jgi:hypothetical protein